MPAGLAELIAVARGDRPADLILAGGPDAIRMVKFVIRKSPAAGLPEGYDLESDQFGALFDGEAKEGMKAFLEKRKPEW